MTAFFPMKPSAAPNAALPVHSPPPVASFTNLRAAFGLCHGAGILQTQQTTKPITTARRTSECRNRPHKFNKADSQRADGAATGRILPGAIKLSTGRGRRLNAVIEVNPGALAIADAPDAECWLGLETGQSRTMSWDRCTACRC